MYQGSVEPLSARTPGPGSGCWEGMTGTSATYMMDIAFE